MVEISLKKSIVRELEYPLRKTKRKQNEQLRNYIQFILF